MELKKVFLFIIIGTLLPEAYSIWDPVSIGLAGGAIWGTYNWNFIKSSTYCKFTECCKEDSHSLHELKRNLENNVFGQHIVVNQLIPALEAHLSSKTASRKPLVISFHGTPGTGKNYVAQFIAEALFEKGMESKYVHKFLGRSDFPLVSMTDFYKEMINLEVRKGIRECPQSLFIFDEVDKIPPGVFESLTSLVQHNVILDGNNFSKAIFLFLSNTAGVQISNHLAELMKMGIMREETRLSQFEKILEKSAYNLEGGFKKSSLIEAHVIDHYIPFLPLEKYHVEECIKAEFRRWRINPTKENIEEVLGENIVYDTTHKLFSITGCKTVEKKVAVHAMHMNKT